MISPQSLGFSKRILSYILKGPSFTDTQELWELKLKEIFFTCFKKQIKSEVLFEIFQNFPCGSNLNDTNLFQEKIRVLQSEYAYYKIAERERIEAILDLKIIKVEFYTGDESFYRLILNSHGELDCSPKALMHQGDFRLLFLSKFSKKLEKLETEDWEKITSFWLETAEVLTSTSISRGSELKEFLNDFISDPIKKDNEEDTLNMLKLGQVIYYKDGIAFRVEAFRKYLERLKRPINRVNLFAYLHNWSWEDLTIGPSELRVRCWFKKL